MIKPINGHILIEPLTQEGFIASQKETYEEIGIVLDDGQIECPHGTITSPLNSTGCECFKALRKGDKVFFDSWLAAKYPTGDGEKFFWLVKYEDIRAIEHAQDEVSK